MDEDKNKSKNNFKDLEDLVSQAREKGREDTGVKPMSASLNTKVEKEEKLPNIRTYRNDAHSEIEKNDGSLARMKLAEEKARTKTLPKKSIGKVFVVFALGLFLIGVGAVSYIFINTDRNTEEPTEIVEKPETIIEYNEYTTLSKDELQNYPKEGSGITYVQADSSLGELFENIPNRLLRNSNNFMIGVNHNFNNSPFIIIESEYRYAFPEMINWESDINSDMANLFNIQTTNQTFTDNSIGNYSIRESTGITYTTTESGYIIISTNNQSLEEIINKL